MGKTWNPLRNLCTMVLWYYDLKKKNTSLQQKSESCCIMVLLNNGVTMCHVLTKILCNRFIFYQFMKHEALPNQLPLSKTLCTFITCWSNEALKVHRSKNKKKTKDTSWVVPPPSNSHHQDYYILIGNPYKPSFATVTVRGPYPKHTSSTLFFVFFTSPRKPKSPKRSTTCFLCFFGLHRGPAILLVLPLSFFTNLSISSVFSTSRKRFAFFSPQGPKQQLFWWK